MQSLLHCGIIKERRRENEFFQTHRRVRHDGGAVRGDHAGGRVAGDRAVRFAHVCGAVSDSAGAQVRAQISPDAVAGGERDQPDSGAGDRAESNVFVLFRLFLFLFPIL